MLVHHLQKKKKESKNLKKQEIHNISKRTRKACLEHEMAYGDFENLVEQSKNKLYLMKN